MKSKLTISIFFILCVLNSFAQNDFEELEPKKLEQVAEALILINYGQVDDSSPKKTAFYYDNTGAYWSTTFHSWNKIDPIDKVVSELSSYSGYEFISETKFKKLDLNELKEMILTNSNKDRVNLVHYDFETNTGNVKAYRLLE